MGMSVQLRAHFWVQTPSSFSTTVRSSWPTATFLSASGATRGSSCFPVGKSSLIEPRPSICPPPARIMGKNRSNAARQHLYSKPLKQTSPTFLNPRMTLWQLRDTFCNYLLLIVITSQQLDKVRSRYNKHSTLYIT